MNQRKRGTGLFERDGRTGWVAHHGAITGGRQEEIFSGDDTCESTVEEGEAIALEQSLLPTFTMGHPGSVAEKL